MLKMLLFRDVHHHKMLRSDWAVPGQGLVQGHRSHLSSFYFILNSLLGLYCHQGPWILGTGKFRLRQETKWDPSCLRGRSISPSRAKLLLTGGLQPGPSQVFQRQQARYAQKEGDHMVLSSPQQSPTCGPNSPAAASPRRAHRMPGPWRLQGKDHWAGWGVAA